MFDWDNSDFWGSREANWDVAVCCGDLRSTQLLLDHENSNGYTALHQANWIQNIALIDLLLARGADPNLSSTDGSTPLHDACHFTDTRCVLLLLQYGADDTRCGRTPLDIAKERGNH